MSVSIGGYGVAFDHDCKLGEFLSGTMPPEEVLFGRWKPEPKMHASVIDNYEAFTPPYPPLPPIEIGELQWPSGASRYARALYIVDQSSMFKIAKAAWGYSGILSDLETSLVPANWGVDQATELLVTIDGNEFFSCTMLPLPPHRVPGTGGDLWILPLVDRRFLWQHIAYEPDGSAATWEALFADLETTIGTTLVRPSIATEYGVPDSLTIQPGIQATALLDCSALSVGLRPIMDPGAGNIIRLLDATASGLRVSATLAKTGLQAGGSRGMAVVPNEMSVFCRKANEFSLACNDQEKRTAAIASGSADVPLLAHSAWVVDERLFGSSLVTINDSETDYYAQQVATDQSAWFAGGGQYSFAGAIAYAPSGFDDYLTIRTAEVESGHYSFASRVFELPATFLPNLLLSQTENLRVASVVEDFTAADQLTDPGEAYFPGQPTKRVIIAGLDTADTGKTITAYYRCGTGWTRVSDTSGGDVHYDYQLLTNWFGGIALARKRTMDMVDLGAIVIVRDPRGIFNFQKAGDGGIMFYQPPTGRYYAIQANCRTSPVPPVDPIGACCYQSNDGWDCFDATEADCVAFGGTYQGDGTACESTECDPGP